MFCKMQAVNSLYKQSLKNLSNLIDLVLGGYIAAYL